MSYQPKEFSESDWNRAYIVAHAIVSSEEGETVSEAGERVCVSIVNALYETYNRESVNAAINTARVIIRAKYITR